MLTMLPPLSGLPQVHHQESNGDVINGTLVSRAIEYPLGLDAVIVTP